MLQMSLTGPSVPPGELGIRRRFAQCVVRAVDPPE